MLLGVVAPFAYHCNKKDATTRNIFGATMFGVVVPTKARGDSAWDFGGLFFVVRILGGFLGSLKDFVGF